MPPRAGGFAFSIANAIIRAICRLDMYTTSPERPDNQTADFQSLLCCLLDIHPAHLLSAGRLGRRAAIQFVDGAVEQVGEYG